MRQPLFLLSMLALSGCTVPQTAPLPAGNWDLQVCEGSASKGSTCARLSQTLDLEVRHAQGAADVGRVLFASTISSTAAQTLLAQGAAVLHSFDVKSVQTVDPDLPFFRVELGAGIYTTSAMLPWTDTDKSSPEIHVLRQHLKEITHAF